MNLLDGFFGLFRGWFRIPEEEDYDDMDQPISHNIILNSSKSLFDFRIKYYCFKPREACQQVLRCFVRELWSIPK